MTGVGGQGSTLMGGSLRPMGLNSGGLFPSSCKWWPSFPSFVLLCAGGMVCGSQPSPRGQLGSDTNPIEAAGG